MIIYNVTVNIDADVHDDWLNWMKDHHVPDVMATGMFLDAKISKIMAEEEGGMSYSIQYLCESEELYEQYQDIHATRLQLDHVNRYRGKFVAFRTLLKVEKTFTK